MAAMAAASSPVAMLVAIGAYDSSMIRSIVNTDTRLNIPQVSKQLPVSPPFRQSDATWRFFAMKEDPLSQDLQRLSWPP
jgi:hypothetical protein